MMKPMFRDIQRLNVFTKQNSPTAKDMALGKAAIHMGRTNEAERRRAGDATALPGSTFMEKWTAAYSALNFAKR